MKLIWRIIRWPTFILATLVLLLYVTGNEYLLRGISATYLRGKTSATIDDLRFFQPLEVKAGTPFPWYPSDHAKTALPEDLENVLKKYRTAAFLVIQNDSIVYENYWEGHTAKTLSNSFSMAKSVTATLVQIAIQAGAIKGWDEPVSQWIPELQGEFATDLTLRHLATMSAGLDWKESYSSPFSITAKSYYAKDVNEVVVNGVKVVNPPGVVFEYQSGATQLLAIALERATGQSLQNFNSQFLWQHLGTNELAFYHGDKNGNAYAYCCLNSNARDFARLGQLYLHGGTIHGKRILDKTFVAEATKPDLSAEYGISFWVHQDVPYVNHYFRGILGQYIINLPEYNATIVRLGHKAGKKDSSNHPHEVAEIMDLTARHLLRDVRSLAPVPPPKMQ